MYYLKYFLKEPFDFVPEELFADNNLFMVTETWNVPPASAGSLLCYFTLFI